MRFLVGRIDWRGCIARRRLAATGAAQQEQQCEKQETDLFQGSISGHHVTFTIRFALIYFATGFRWNEVNSTVNTRKTAEISTNTYAFSFFDGNEN